MSEQDTSGTSDQPWVFEFLGLVLIVAVLAACWGYIALGDHERLEAPPTKPDETEAGTSDTGTTEAAGAEDETGATEPTTADETEATETD